MATESVRIVRTECDANNGIANLIDSDGRRWSEILVIRHIEGNTTNFYVDDGRKVAYVGVRSSGLVKWVQTHADGSWTNNLDALPSSRAA